MSRRLAGRKQEKPARITRARLLPRVSKKRRVVRVTVPAGFSHEFVLSFRRFRTPANRRSVQFKQFVWQSKLLPLLSFRELAVAYKPNRVHRTRRRTRKSMQVFQFLKPVLRLSDQAILSFALMIAGLGGSLYFATHLQTAPDLFITKEGAVAPELPKTASAFASQLQGNEKINLIKPASDVKPAPPPKPALPKVMSRSEPTRIRIPKIQLDTSLIQVGLGPTGNMAVPDIYDQAAWYTHSPTPGERGPSVITGHVDSPRNIAIFWRLRELLPGDTVQVDRQDGTTATFIVTEIQQFPQDQFPTAAVYGNTDYAALRLITCGGTFNTLTGHYTHNTVVYGKLVE